MLFLIFVLSFTKSPLLYQIFKPSELSATVLELFAEGLWGHHLSLISKWPAAPLPLSLAPCSCGSPSTDTQEGVGVGKGRA